MSTSKSFHDLKFKNVAPFRIYLSICGKEKRNLFISFLFLVVKHSPALILPIIIGKVLNAIITPDDSTIHNLIVYSAIILLLFFQNIFTHTWFIKFLSKANRSIEKGLRYSLIKRMQELSISFHNQFASGKLQAKVLRDVESIEILNRQMMNMVVTGLITIIFAMIATLLHNWFIALFYLVTVPISTVLIRIFQKQMAQRNKEYRNEIEVFSAKVNEMVQMIPITRAHGVESAEINKMDQQLIRVKEKGILLDIINAFFGASTWVTYQVFQFVCLLVTAIMALKGMIPVGDVVMYQGFFALIIYSVNMIINVLPEINRGFDSISSLGEILECPDVENNKGKKEIIRIQGNVHFDRVSYNYHEKRKVIRNFSLDVKAGESIAFVGESGAGKSTLINLVIGYLRPVCGTIYLDEEDMNQLDLRSYRKFISVVPQNVILFSGSIRENILYGIEDENIDEAWFQKVAEISRVSEFVQQMPQGFETSIGEHGNQLSGGQRQRIAIARALVRNPKIVIFDEATSALDVQSERAIQQAISEIIKERTTFIIAHRLSTVRMVDKIVVIENGTIAEAGSHEELMQKQGAYYKMNKLTSLA